MTERANCFPVAIFILFSLCHMTLTPLYYATKKLHSKFYLALSVKLFRLLLRIPNGDLKVNWDSFLFYIHGLRPLWTISTFIAWSLQALFHLPKTDGCRQGILFFSESILWQRSSENGISTPLKPPISKGNWSSLAIQRNLGKNKPSNGWYNPFQRLNGLPMQNAPLLVRSRCLNILAAILTG